MKGMLHKVLRFGEFYSLDKETGCESRREWNKDNKKREMYLGYERDKEHPKE